MQQLHSAGLIKRPQATFGAANYIGDIYEANENKYSHWAKLKADQDMIDNYGLWAVRLDEVHLGNQSVINTIL